MKKLQLLSIVVLLTTAVLSSARLFAKDWGAKESFAVVNPVVRSELSKTQSLSGEWDFTTENAVNFRLNVGEGTWGDSVKDWSNSQKLTVPGIWEAQGIGEPKPGDAWDCLWDYAMWDLNYVYSGRALYHRTFDVPADWTNGRVWLKVGGVGACGYFWVNNKRAAFVDAYAGARKYDVTDLVKPGETNDLVAQVRNDVPSRLGLLAEIENFGGFYRDVELEFTPSVYVDDVWARGDFATRSADVRVYVKSTDEHDVDVPLYEDELSPNDRDKLNELRRSGLSLVDAKGGTRLIEGLGSVEVSVKTLDGKVVGRQEMKGETSVSSNGLANAFRFSIPIEDCQLWTPESPNLYLADVVIKDADGKPIHGWTERFGVREFKVVGNQFFLNGKPYFLRGGGDHNYDQINLIEPPNRDRFREHISIYKEAGFNYMRFHTHSPLPEYCEIADEKGILLQPELPYYHDVPSRGFEFNPKREMFELFRTNRRYVSFASYSYGNEGYLGAPLDVEMYNWVKEYDPDRLVVHQDGGPHNDPNNCDFKTGAILPWTPGKYDSFDRPFVAHEYLNLSIKMDPRYESRFTGVRRSPVDYKAWVEGLEEVGLDEKWGASLLDAAAKLQAIYQKKGLESARLDPACDGYLFWSLVDASIPQGNCVAAQGYLNPFWEPRPNGNSPKTFHQFNGPTALLISFDRPAPIFENGDSFNVSFKISHYDAYDIPNSYVEWKVVSTDGKILASDFVPTKKIASGYAGQIARCAINIPENFVDRPTAGRFVVSLRGTDVVNDWDCWFFPKDSKRSLNGFAVSPAWYEDFTKLYYDVKPISADALNAKEAIDNDVWIVAPNELAFSRGRCC